MQSEVEKEEGKKNIEGHKAESVVFPSPNWLHAVIFRLFVYL